MTSEELEDKLLSLQIECRDCPDREIYGSDVCKSCHTPRDIARLEGEIARVKAQEVRKPRDRRQSKPNMIYARGIAR